MKNEFKISMAIRGPERETLLEDAELEKYREGFVIIFRTNDEEYETFTKLIRKIITLRTD